MMTDEGKRVAAALSVVLTALADLDKVSPADAEMIWTSLANHLRSARPQALMALQEVP
jgi:hypothetical protein